MIVALSKDIAPREKEAVFSYLADNGFSVREQNVGGDVLLVASGGAGGAVSGGGIPAVSERELSLLPGVARVAQTSKPYQLAARETKGSDTIVSVNTGTGSVVQIGGARICVIAGPCAVESKEQIAETAACVRESGAVILRGGAYKPRTSPYAFQGLGMKGLEYMKAAGEAQGMPIVTEVVSPELVDGMKDLTDIFQIGARNMQNFELLKRAGSLGKPVLLKRGASATIEEWLLAAEYLLAAGSKDVMLCERGIRTFETYTRNTLDISAIPVLKGLSHLPVIVDPSHAVGIRDMVPRAALAAIAAGADGLTVEVHPKPEKALSDGPQSLYPEQFERLMRDIEALAPVVGKELLRLPRKESGEPKKNTADANWAQAFSLVTEKIAFCGESGAYAEQALDRAFGENAPRLALPSFPAVFDAVLDGSAVCGIVPVENSLTGTIHENYDLFTRYPDVAITGELKLRIVHCLIAADGASLDTIRTVRSHSQGFAQCKEFLDKHPQWRFETWNNTAAAVHSIAGDGQTPDITVAAIASEAAAKVYGLKALKSGIEKNPQNYTRFVIIARRNVSLPAAAFLRENSAGEQPNKASLVFSIKDEAGSLYPCLQILNKYGISMTKLESRPILGQPWSYMFYVDITVEESGKLETALAELKNQTENMLFLGVYRAAV
jgi:3-deoxy-7-phosphoheptulonate synthase